MSFPFPKVEVNMFPFCTRTRSRWDWRDALRAFLMCWRFSWTLSQWAASIGETTLTENASKENNCRRDSSGCITNRDSGKRMGVFSMDERTQTNKTLITSFYYVGSLFLKSFLSVGWGGGSGFSFQTNMKHCLLFQLYVGDVPSFFKCWTY